MSLQTFCSQFTKEAKSADINCCKVTRKQNPTNFLLMTKKESNCENKYKHLLFRCFVFSPVSKNLSERRSNKSDMSPVSQRSTLPLGKAQNRVSQVLQVQVPLNPLRKKSTAKDTGTPSEPSSANLYHHYTNSYSKIYFFTFFYLD